MIGILSALSLAAPQVAVLPLAWAAIAAPAGVSPSQAPGAVECAGVSAAGSPSEGVPRADQRTTAAIFTELERLSIGRQQPGVGAPWSRVQALVDGLIQGLLQGLGQEPQTGLSEDPAVARLFTDLAISATAAQRLDLVQACERLLSARDGQESRSRLLRAQILILEPVIAATGGRGPMARRATALYEEIALEVTHPETGEAPPFMRRSRLRLERLRIGAPMPRFVARDTAGNELRSAQLEGEVLVLRFWDESSPASLAAHRADGAWVREFWDAPFDLFGVARSEDREAYLRQLEAAQFGGVQLFDGPISDALAEALEGYDWGAPGAFGASAEHGAGLRLSNRWGAPTPGSLFVVDARGRIRGRDLSPDATRSLVRQLIAEEQFRRREQLLEGARSR